MKLKVLASTHGYGFVLRQLTGELIHTHIGLLPQDFQFNKQTAELYALMQARLHLETDELAGFRVALVCSSLPFEGFRPGERKAA